MSQYVRFIWPWMLTALLLVPVMIVYYRHLLRRRARMNVDLGPLGLVRHESGGKPGRRRHLPSVLFLIGLTLVLLALARPEALVSLPRIQGTVILAFDVSNSMLADDLAPSRIDAAKEAAVAFVDNQPSTIELGVVAFGNGGLVVQKPTSDRTAVLSSIQRISAQGGTSLGQGIFTSLNAIAGERLTLNEEAFDVETGAVDTARLDVGRYPSSVILMLTDGENTDAIDPLSMAQVAAEAGVRIYTVGIGRADGTMLEVDGFNVVTRLDEETLQEVANVTNGRYYQATDVETLQEIYETVDLQLTIDAEMTEITALLAGLGALFLLAGGLLSLFWFGRAP